MCAAIDLTDAGNRDLVTRFASGTGPVFLTQVDCGSTMQHNSLLECGIPVFVHTCTHEMDVGINCPGK